MEYDIHVQDENKVVMSVCKGRLDLESAKAMTRDVRKRAFELGYDVLYDMTDVSLGVGISDAYYFSRDSDIYEDFAHRRGKAAVVYKSDKDFWEFLELTTRNVGVNVRIFGEMEKALEWLSEEQAG